MIPFRPLHNVIYALGLWMASAGALAAPSGADLAQACENALVGGFNGIQGRMCAWYVTPCDCAAGRKPEAPRVCLPGTIATEALAREVVTGLAAQPELQLRDADVAAAMILSGTYPCPQ